MVPPSAFIPMAEKSGFIVPMSDWGLKCSCGYVNQLEELNLFPEPGYIAVNLSAKYFHQADFGTGYSSIAYLKKLPIDRSFVSNVDTSPDDAVIVSTVLSMAHHFQLNVIAEGVETEAEWKFLIIQGSREFQGFYFSKGTPFKDFLTLLAEKKDTHGHTC